MPLDVTEERLALFVDEVIERTKLLPHFADDGYGGKDWRARVHLVGHSMGGLIIAGYLQKNGFGKVKKGRDPRIAVSRLAGSAEKGE